MRKGAASTRNPTWLMPVLHKRCIFRRQTLANNKLTINPDKRLACTWVESFGVQAVPLLVIGQGSIIGLSPIRLGAWDRTEGFRRRVKDGRVED